MFEKGINASNRLEKERAGEEDAFRIYTATDFIKTATSSIYISHNPHTAIQGKNGKRK